jgi:2,3-bisphosphoglycerate-independent phosphoglycerate mutase
MMPMEEEESKMNLYQQLIQQKIKTITPEELVSYSHDYGIPLTVEQAKKVLHIARTNKINVFDPQERKKWVKELAKITSPQTAKKANELFLKFINKKGI